MPVSQKARGKRSATWDGAQGAATFEKEPANPSKRRQARLGFQRGSIAGAGHGAKGRGWQAAKRLGEPAQHERTQGNARSCLARALLSVPKPSRLMASVLAAGSGGSNLTAPACPATRQRASPGHVTANHQPLTANHPARLEHAQRQRDHGRGGLEGGARRGGHRHAARARATARARAARAVADLRGGHAMSPRCYPCQGACAAGLAGGPHARARQQAGQQYLGPWSGPVEQHPSP
jgi:hypothetical protein